MNQYIIDAFTRDGNNTNLEVNNLDVGCITSLNNNFELDSNGNLTVNSITANTINTMAFTNMVYPVGSIYMSVNSTSPSVLFGGQWEQLKDRFLLGCGDTYQNNVTGGEANHTLTINEMPNHAHPIRAGYGDFGEPPVTSDAYRYQFWGGNDRGWKTGLLGAGETGGGQSHNNMPPYLTVYMWKRIS